MNLQELMEEALADVKAEAKNHAEQRKERVESILRRRGLILDACKKAMQEVKYGEVLNQYMRLVYEVGFSPNEDVVIAEVALPDCAPIRMGFLVETEEGCTAPEVTAKMVNLSASPNNTVVETGSHWSFKAFAVASEYTYQSWHNRTGYFVPANAKEATARPTGWSYTNSLTLAVGMAQSHFGKAAMCSLKAEERKQHEQRMAIQRDTQKSIINGLRQQLDTLVRSGELTPLKLILANIAIELRKQNDLGEI